MLSIKLQTQQIDIEDIVVRDNELIPMLSFLCPHSHAFVPVSSFPSFRSCVLVPMLSFLCHHSHAFIPVSSFPCFHSCVIIPMLSFLCPHSHAFIPVSSFPCFYSCVLISFTILHAFIFILVPSFLFHFLLSSFPGYPYGIWSHNGGIGRTCW